MLSRRSFLGTATALASASLVSGRVQAAGIPEAPTMDKVATQPPLHPSSGPEYRPVVTLNGWSLPWRMNGDWKEFHLVAEPVVREFAEGMKAHLWGYNGQTPGPTIEAVEGDKVRIFVTNKLPEYTTVHWHGMILPSGMDGVGGLTQPHINPGKTFVYEFQVKHSGTFMYHPHADEMVQMAMGMMGMFVVHPKDPGFRPVDRDFVFVMSSYDMDPGTYLPKVTEMTNFNMWSWNARVFPGIDPLPVRLGDRVRVRIGNLTMTNHPIHLHGHSFSVSGTDGGWVPESAQWPETTIDVPVGAIRAFDVLADNPGDWAFHCHKSHHTMNAMGHDLRTLIGVSKKDIAKAVKRLAPDSMAMGSTRIAMGEMVMPPPDDPLPMMTGARALPFPRLNLLSWYVFIVGGVFTLYAVITGGVDTGWTFYTPYSTAAATTKVIPTALGIFITGFSSILTGLNFIVTIHRMRAPGLTWFRLPLFIWANYATSLIMVLGTPVLAITIALVGLERAFHIGIFDPALGGDPVLFQHLFWFYSHPAVYIMILPSMGVISEIICCFSRKGIFGYSFVAISSLAIALLGFLVWGHHMFVSSQSPYAGLIFSVLSFAVAIPSAVKVFNWTATLYKGAISFEAPMLCAMGFIGLFTIGGLTGLFLASLGLDVHVHDTYFVVAHFHYIMVGGALMGYLGGMHFWWPKITGRLYPEGWARIAVVIVFLGFNLTFFPQFVLGYLGMPRRYYAYPDEFQVLNVMSTAGASILAVGYLLPACYFLWSLRYGQIAPANPWGARGLEWDTPSPPPTENFEETPVVTQEAYAYALQEVKVG